MILQKYKSIKRKYEIYQFTKVNECTLSLNSFYTGDLNNLIVGKNSVVNSYANFRFKSGKIVIGSNCLFGQNVTVIANTYVSDGENPISPKNMYSKDVCIGDNVWIGVNAVIMPGVKVGNNSIIAASAVVTKDVNENEIWAGIPARFIRKRDVQDGWK